MKKLLIQLSLACSLTGLSQIPAHVPTNGLIGYWPFSGNASDLSVNSNNGSVNGAVLTTDRFGNPSGAYSFNGSNDYIVVPDHASLSGFGDMSISVWVNIATFNGIQGIVAKWYQTNCNPNFPSDTYAAEISNNIIQFATNNNNLTAFTTPPPAMTAADLNVWKHIVYIHRATQGASIYINGVLAATDPATGSICISTNPLYFGADYDGNFNMIHRYFNGKIDEIGIWNRALSNCEINQLYTSSVFSVTAASSNTTVCPGSPVALIASGAHSYLWSTSASGSVIVVSPLITTTYSVTGTNSITGCSQTHTITQVVSECTGIPGNTSNIHGLSIYPNPSAHDLTIDFYSAAKEAFTLSLEDISGKNILRRYFVSDRNNHHYAQIALTQFSNGIYILKIADAYQNTVKTQKVIVDR